MGVLDCSGVFCIGGNQFDQADFATGAQSHRRSPVACAAADVELCVTAMIGSCKVTLLQPFEHAKRKELTSVRVAGQRNIDTGAAGSFERSWCVADNKCRP